MLFKKVWSKIFLLLTIMVASLSLTSMSKVSAACKPEQVKSIEEQIEEYVSILEQEANLAVIYSDVAIREKKINMSIRAISRECQNKTSYKKQEREKEDLREG